MLQPVWAYLLVAVIAGIPSLLMYLSSRHKTESEAGAIDVSMLKPLREELRATQSDMVVLRADLVAARTEIGEMRIALIKTHADLDRWTAGAQLLMSQLRAIGELPLFTGKDVGR
jgi:hypothetical protein